MRRRVVGGCTHIEHCLGARTCRPHAVAFCFVVRTMNIERNVPLTNKTTLGVGGPAEYFCALTNVDEVFDVVVWAQQHTSSIFVLGEGSNVLIPDEGIQGLVVQITDSGVEWHDDGRVIAVAGANWDELVAESAHRGLWGIENLSGIPGTVGAAPIQNIGAYGTELKDVCEWVEVFDTQTEQFQKLTPPECVFGYRGSVFKYDAGKQYIITRIALTLEKNGTPNLIYKDLSEYFLDNKTPTLPDIREAVLAIRAQKFPDLAEVGTAGSFFKNPITSKQTYDKLKEQYFDMPGYKIDEAHIKIPLAWILDHVCKLKGYREGSVGLWEQQPLVLVNYGDATAREVEMFAEKIVQIVKSKTGIVIEREVSLLRELNTTPIHE